MGRLHPTWVAEDAGRWETAARLLVLASGGRLVWSAVPVAVGAAVPPVPGWPRSRPGGRARRVWRPGRADAGAVATAAAVRTTWRCR